MKNNLRLCMVDGEIGYFHGWEQYYNVVSPSPMVGGHPGGQIGYILGLVEFYGKPVKKVRPDIIKFCDDLNKGLYTINEMHEDK